MSIRSIVEINHDYIYGLRNSPEMMRIFIDHLLRDDNSEGEQLAPGVRFLKQRHHSETIKLIVK